MPVARNVWQQIRSGSPASRTRRLIMARASRRLSPRSVSSRRRFKERKRGVFRSSPLPVAALWCKRATEHAGGKPWKYLLIPHDAINESKTLAGLAATFEFHGA